MSTTYRISSFLLRIALAFVLLLVLSLPARTFVEAVGAILYIAPGGLTSGPCASWATACDLQYALGAAGSGSTLWVKKGTYFPTTTTDRTLSFALKNGVALYGGFAGTETAFSQRNPAANITTLSGDIGLPNNSSDNSYHVVIAGTGINSTAILDGFIVRAGNANGANLDSGGGGMFNSGSPTLTNLTFILNSAAFGGGMISYIDSNPTLTNVTFSSNSATSNGGGIYNNSGSPKLTNVSFSGNSAISSGGGMFSFAGSMFASSPTLTNVTFSGNSATTVSGGGMFTSGGSPTLTNVTFSGNSAAANGGGMYNSSSSPTLTNVTFSGNSANTGGGIFTSGNSNAIIRNSILYGDTGGEIILVSANMSVSYSDIQGDYRGTGNIDADPLLGSLANNGGVTRTMALGAGSPAIDTANDAYCPTHDQRGLARPQGIHCDMGAYEAKGPITIRVAANELNSYFLAPGLSRRVSFGGVNGGPVQFTHSNNTPLIAAERVIYKVNNSNTSFSEMMGLPASQLDKTYWLPWYNNVDLDTQLRIANVSGSQATVTVTIGGVSKPPFNLAAGGSTRVSYADVNNGPVEIVSTQNIVASERVIYKANGVNTSFSEMMALPEKQLDTTYWLPVYVNNIYLDTQLRIANVTNNPATVTVTIDGTAIPTINLAAGESTRVNYSVLENGPVKIVSNQNIVVSERLIYKLNNISSSFSEMMALPNNKLGTTYWLPWYNNVGLDTQLRIVNVTNNPATVTVTIDGSVTLINLAAGQSSYINIIGLDTGPVKIESDQNIIASARVIYKVNNVDTSFSEMMALSNSLLDTSYWFPWYNNVDLDTQLRFGVP